MSEADVGSARPDLDAARAALLAEIARDVAHELRGPVQSIVVNLEVARLRIRKASPDEATERLSIIEQEVLRMHRVADAFVSLNRPGDPEAAPVLLESVLAGIEPLAAVVARSAGTSFERAGSDPAILARVSSTRGATAILRLIVDAVAAAGRDGGVTVSAVAEAGGAELRIAVHRDSGQPVDRTALARRVEAVRATWLEEMGGTAAVAAGSDAGDATVVARFVDPA